MYAKYVYNTSATVDQMLDDIFEIFCGETTVSNLSAGCDTVNTQILTAHSVSPWVDFDDVSASKRVMRLQLDDEPGVYKYVSLNHDGVDELAFTIMESWNNTTHVPTNEVAVNYDKEGMGFNNGLGGTMHLYGSQYCLIMLHQSITDIWGQGRGDPTYGSLGVFECSRDHPSLAVGDMPNWFISSTALLWGDDDTTMKASFWKGRDYLDVVQTPFTAEMTYPGRDSNYSDFNSYPVTGGLGTSTALEEIGEPTTFGLEPILIGGSPTKTHLQATTFYGNVSSRCGIWMMPVGTQNCGSLVDVDGVAHIIFKAGYTTSTAGAIYGGKFIVPYG